ELRRRVHAGVPPVVRRRRPRGQGPADALPARRRGRRPAAQPGRRHPPERGRAPACRRARLALPAPPSEEVRAVGPIRISAATLPAVGGGGGLGGWERSRRLRMSEGELSVNEAAFWQSLYAGQGDRWELGGPAPPLVEYLATHPRLPGEHVAVPGCGRGHDARLLARTGYRVRAFDFADAPIREARALAEQAGAGIPLPPRDPLRLP